MASPRCEPAVKRYSHEKDRDIESDIDSDPEQAYRSRPGKRSTSGAIRQRLIQRKASGSAAADQLDLSATGSGQPLPEDVRRRMEQALGADFSEVRIHQGHQAESVGARAFTRGQDIHFAPGQYDPDSPLGLELLGHELAHVVQQAQGRVGAPSTTGDRVAISEDSSLEREADELGARAARGQLGAAGPTPLAHGTGRMPVQSRSGPIQRKPHEGHKEQQEQAAARRERLAAAQGHMMSRLLTMLVEIRGSSAFSAAEYDYAQTNFGPRLIIAMRTVEAKATGADWFGIIANHDVAGLPDDQIDDLMRFAGVPKESRPVKVTMNGKEFDGTVNQTTRTITILFRARVQVAEIDEIHLSSPDDAEAIATFKPRLKTSIESAWSGHTVRLARPVGGIAAFQSAVHVAFVESGEHLTYLMPPDHRVRENDPDDDQHNHPTSHGDDERGQSRQDAGPAEIHTAEIDGGADMDTGVILDSRGEVLVDPMEPFRLVAEKWGEKLFPGSLSRLNRWSGQ